MRMMVTGVLALLAIVPTAGCVSMGPDYSVEAVSQLKPGMTKAEVTALLGQPSSTTTLADGSQHLMWVHSRGTMLGTAKARSLTVLMTPDGRYAQTVNQNETNIQ